jgi:hypothetical protein
MRALPGLILRINWPTMSERVKIIVGWALITIASTIFVPIGFACVILDSESAVTRDQVVRLEDAANALFIASLLIQCAAAWLFIGKPFRLLRFVMIAVGSVIGSFVFGILFSNGQSFYRIAGFFM